MPIMHTSMLTTLLVGIAFSIVASTNATTTSFLAAGNSIDPSLDEVHTIASLELMDFETNSTSLEKRLDITYCTRSVDNALKCAKAGEYVVAISKSIATLMKGDSDKNDCTAHSGSLDDVTWKVYAEGKNCDTTAQEDTIQGAMTKYIKSLSNGVCGVQCIRLTHGGTYAGYVTLAASGANLNSYYCGSQYQFGDCGAGGNGDV